MEINKIYNENCLDTMKNMPNGFIDLVVTSPPYDGMRTYNGYSFPFEDIAKEAQEKIKGGMDQQTATMQVMMSHQKELQDLMK